MRSERWLTTGLALLLLLSGCAPAPQAEQSAPEPPAASVPAPLPGFDPAQLPGAGRTEENWTLADYPGCLDKDYPTRREEYPLLAGTELENRVQVLRGEQPGPVLYVVAGIHGDERAGWLAGNLLKEASLKAGTLYIVSPANRYGAEHDQRTTKSDRDLNRNFPGDPSGWDAQRIAAAIYGDVEEKAPVLLLDLHEARAKREGRDALGNSVIAQSLDGIGDLVMELLLDSEAGAVCASPLTLYGSPPEGSINRTVTEQLGIPAITVETYREEPLAQRVRNQLELLEYVLHWYGMY